jgi:hypothetical protein
MKNMKKIKIVVLMLLSIAAFVSCVKSDVENFSTGAYIVGFKNAQGSYIYTANDVDPVHISEPINLLGGSNGTECPNAITIPFTIDPSSTAIAGTEYSIDASENKVTIPAGGVFVQLPLTVNPTALQGNLPKTIIINLGSPTSTSNTVVSNAKKSITITIAKCESNLAGTYSLSVTRIDNNAVYLFPNEEITQTGIGEYVTSSTGPYNDLTNDGAPRNGFIFKDVCQTIVIDQQNLGDFYSNLVYGNNTETNAVTLSSTTGQVESITMNYTITFSAGPRKYRAIYTKL